MIEQPEVDVVIQVDNAGVAYRQRKGFLRHSSYWALQDVSFNLLAGETLGVIGRNGVGKSSLLRLLAGIIEPDRGTVVREAGLRTSLLSLNAGFNVQLSGRENVVLSGIIQGMSRQEVDSSMEKILEFAELGAFIDQPVKTYSTGMSARLGFSIALQSNPDVLLIDEVLGVGDAEFRKKSTAAMKQLIGSNKTVLIVSHSLPTIRELCDRVLWLENGVSRMIGGVDEVLDMFENKQEYGV